MFFSLFHKALDHRPAHALDRIQPITDRSAGYRKDAFTFIDIRSQNTDSHLTACHDIFRYFRRIVNHRSHQSSHELYRIVIFQPRGLICHHGISSRMGFIKCIFGKINHFIIDFIGSCLRDPACYAPRNLLLFISIDKILPLLLHDRSLFLGHGPANQIASPQGIARQLLHNLHNLLLIDDTAIGRLQNRLQLRTVIGNRFRMVLSPDILGNKVHGTWTVQRDACYHILQTPGLQFFYEVLHPCAFQLEDPVRPAGSK